MRAVHCNYCNAVVGGVTDDVYLARHTTPDAKLEEGHMSNSWTREKVKERLREAAKIERLMQKPRGPTGYKSCLPDPIRSRVTDYPDEAVTVVAPKPVGYQITIYDEVMVVNPWHTWTTKDEWRVIWEWAQDRMGWKSIAFKFNMDKPKALRLFHGGVNRIVAGLNK